jgi:hypothetical protein
MQIYSTCGGAGCVVSSCIPAVFWLCCLVLSQQAIVKSGCQKGEGDNSIASDAWNGAEATIFMSFSQDSFV